jgi:acetyl-CoA carboxylase carboxyl transferase subunit beta
VRAPGAIRSIAGFITGRSGARARRAPEEGWPDQTADTLPPACPGCGRPTDDDLSRTLGVCPSCRYHWRISARRRIAGLLDPETFVEEDADVAGDDPLRFACPVPYKDLYAAAQQRTGLSEAVVTGHGEVLGHRLGLAVFDFGFMGGTMGVAVGAKLVRLYERAVKHRWPVVVVTASGGARLQEGTVALSQMAAVAAAMQRHHEAGLLSISVLADPSTGGVLVSPGTLGDIVLAEPGAHIAFAGTRVSGSSHPPRAEWVEEHGMVDAIVDRSDLRQTIGQLIGLVIRESRPLPRRLRPGPAPRPASEGPPPASGRQALEMARRPDRPSALDYIRRLMDEFVELHGDRLYGDDETIVAGIGSLGGQSAVIIGEERSRPAAEPEHRGRPRPEGFRKVLRLASLAARFGLPVITLIDTPGALVGEESEGRGLASALGRCLRTFSVLPVPVVAAVIGEGTSGAAIALAPADHLLMQECATFESISPEGAAAILGRDPDEVPQIADSMRLTAQDALALGVVDEIVPEPDGGAQTDPDAAAALLGEALLAALAESQRWLPARLVERRYRRLVSIGEPYLERADHEATESRESRRLGPHRSASAQPADGTGQA